MRCEWQRVGKGRYRELYEKSRQPGVDEFRLIEPMPCGRLADAETDDDSSPFLTSEHIQEVCRFHRETNRRLKKDAQGRLIHKTCLDRRRYDHRKATKYDTTERLSRYSGTTQTIKTIGDQPCY